MTRGRYILEPYNGLSSRFRCPNCRSKGSFVRYIDTELNEYLPECYGKCNREVKCGYWKNPYKDRIWESDIEVMNKGNIRPKKVSLPSRKVQNPSRLDFEYVSKTMSHYETNS